MINSDALKGYNDIMILSILIEGDSYGYEISKRIRDITNNKYLIKETTLYSAFNRLEKNGHIEKYSGTQTFGKQRNYYKITPSGKDYYSKRCDEWRDTVVIVNNFIKEG
ncbi:PadR family transcriptional regulator [Dethiobacter alkaliphilus]|uniref:PadR family transcriptional regulator n=1 Tax=Dethiobacter alkaliphilus TaxID=427926 RepID=UPI002226917C|nr:PadR family transcriptional regulator [Dethiobacter alkaliphilus]MCW3491522.1 PadR family transcriptional regulator [Dethiobacter alkaliphilus]